MICWDPRCGREILGPIVWMGEEDEDGQPFELPFHPACADAPWPLYEVRRGWVEEDRPVTQGDGDRGED